MPGGRIPQRRERVLVRFRTSPNTRGQGELHADRRPWVCRCGNAAHFAVRFTQYKDAPRRARQAYGMGKHDGKELRVVLCARNLLCGLRKRVEF